MFDQWRATAVGDSDERSVSVPGKPDAFAGADGVTYRTAFDDPREPGDDVAVVELRGLYARSEVDVTGQRLDGEGAVEHDAYFEPLRIPFLPYEDNELAVTCYAPDDRFGGLHDTDAVPDAAAVPGIWWDAHLESRPLPYIDRLRVRPEVTDDGVRLRVRTTVVTEDPIEDRITYSLKPEGDFTTRGMMNRGSVETNGPGKTTVEHTVDIRDPTLWWPRELGKQHRYTLRATLGDSERTVTTGICDIDHSDGEFVVNDQPVPIRGVTLQTADPADVERAVDSNANVVRAPAHVLPQSVYEACDRAGLLVWQGLPLTGPGEFDVDRGQTLADALVGTYARHPSLAAFGVHDEPTDTFDDALGSGFLDRLRLRFRAWRTSYDRRSADAVADEFPDYRPVFPVVGAPGLDHDAAAYYPGWDYGEADSIDDLLERYPADVLAAFGAGALGEDVETAAGFDSAKHAAHVDGGVEESQSYQRAVLRTVAERARIEGVGTVAATLRDTDGAGMGVYTDDGTPKAGQSALSTVFEPVQAFLRDPMPGQTELLVCNDRPTPLSTTLSWEVGDETGEKEMTVDAGGRWTDTVDLPADGGTVTLTLETPDGPVRNRYER